MKCADPGNGACACARCRSIEANFTDEEKREAVARAERITRQNAAWGRALGQVARDLDGTTIEIGVDASLVDQSSFRVFKRKDAS